MSNYPPYACKCCGVTNGDMFYDWLEGREATQQELADFGGYRKAWNQLREERNKAREAQYLKGVWPKTNIGFRHSDATRAKISATKRAKSKGRDK